jgi:hypothetical protein
LVDGVRHAVADVISPPARDTGQAPPAESPAPDDVGARFDAARERLRSTVAPPDDDAE